MPKIWELPNFLMIYELPNFPDFIDSVVIFVSLLLPLLKSILLHSESNFTSVSKVFNSGALCLTIMSKVTPQSRNLLETLRTAQFCGVICG
jgi:hypothetical protein